MLVALTCLALAVPVSARGRVRLLGTAYEFNTPITIAGATIRVAEIPRARARTRPDGSYRLAVPAHARVTPYIEADGYHTIYLQTFRTTGADLVNVNFQTPTEAIFRALAALLNIPLDANGSITDCAIVSTVSTRNIRDLDYQQFRAYGAHGVPGATAFARPPLVGAIYFNANVLPDPAQPETSEDGGVLWTRVQAGVYTLSAQSLASRFASFVASCVPGRVINANPPWGLYQLAPPSPAQLAARWSRTARGATLRSLRVRGLPADSTVRAVCSGRGCPFARRMFRPDRGRVDLLRGELFEPGATLSVIAFSHAYNAAGARWRIGAHAAPRRTTLCVPLGELQARRRCATS